VYVPSRSKSIYDVPRPVAKTAAPHMTKAERLAKARDALRKLIEYRSSRPVAKQASPGAKSLDTAIDKLRDYVTLVDGRGGK